MKTKPVFLDELTTASSAYKVKVKVIEKTRPLVSPSKKKTTYQKVILEDEKGNKMRGTLFGDQIESYKEAFLYNGVYEISNAPIKPVDLKYKKEEDDLNYEMGFGKQTVIQPVGEEPVSGLPQYTSLRHIPRAGDSDERFDVLGVVLYVDEQTRIIRTRNGRETPVREVTITDHSSDRPVTVTLWSDLAEAECTFFNTWAEKFQIVGFTALKVYTVNGFSLSTSMSTTIVENPTGSKAELLTEWVRTHQALLSDYQAKLLDIQTTRTEKKFTTIADLKKKKASNTLQEERFWLTVTLNDPDLDEINAYIGGEKCGKRAEAAGPCESCGNANCVAGPRYCGDLSEQSVKGGYCSFLMITLTSDITDGTGSLTVTAFTEHAEKMLRSSAPDIFHFKHTKDYSAFDKIKKRLHARQVMVEMGPHTNLSKNGVLQWVLKNVQDIKDASSEDNTRDQRTDTALNVETEGSATGFPNTTESITRSKTAARKKNVNPLP